MNICFFKGKIISKIKFDFMIEKKHICIATFDLKVNNKNIIKIKAYDEIAENCYKKMVENNIILIQGKLNSKYEVILEDFYIL